MVNLLLVARMANLDSRLHNLLIQANLFLLFSDPLSYFSCYENSMPCREVPHSLPLLELGEGGEENETHVSSTNYVEVYTRTKCRQQQPHSIQLPFSIYYVEKYSQCIWSYWQHKRV